MNDLLSNLPNMNSLLGHPLLAGYGSERVKLAARKTLDELRSRIASGEVSQTPSLDECANMVLEAVSGDNNSLRRVINATGIVLHTNLGRAPLGTEFLTAATDSCQGYCNLEYELDTGKRGSRYSHIEGIICEITGAQAAMVVNNNAAAMVLILGALARDKKVAISRGELVEIGGSFRIPEVIVQSGAELVEIGSTNKTKLSDYIDAVENKNAQLLLKVHTSNYEVKGFTQSVPIAELAQYGRSVGLPVVYDFGSCFLIDTERFGFFPGETAMSGLRAGADVVCFSGDKLLGSVQAGIIAGRSQYISAMKQHPLARALRPDKLTLSILESALRLYRFPEEAVQRIPVLSMLFADPNELEKRARKLAEALREILLNWRINVVEVVDETGGGALPNVQLPGWAISIRPRSMRINELERKLRLAPTPVIARIQGNAALISVRTLMPNDEDAVCSAFQTVKYDDGIYFDPFPLFHD
ncbi:MAG: L-seryl-tRNA(Sec) selenium transferase [Oscillospiraceae bacterium]|nr:L-seryl-tRNA(Sec) selenium transferase [Oscillospiraceae bacterium]